ncbi:unnamed protein product [Cylindrotheca closterium]|uniref:Uncharacterized protein n=1 Tax=Cylindrotheca closterium TaxID=2856 RepID=A0AAD2G3L8_9STRA|nr:unnamed protein product [Cylindrotheca closterium]
MEEEDELYGDLGEIDKKNTPATPSTSASPMVAASSKTSSLKSPPPGSIMAQQLEEKVKALEAENLTLKRNMGMLYRTARREIDRKDRQIAELMAELDETKKKS